MRIAHFLERLPCGGIGMVANLLHRGALAAGHESCVITGGRDEGWRDWCSYAADWDGDLGLPEGEEGFLSWRYRRALGAALKGRLREWRPDVVHLHKVPTLVRVAPVLRRLRLPCLLTVHGAVHRYTAAGWSRCWNRHVFREALARTRCLCLSVSPRCAHQVEQGLGLPAGSVAWQRNPVDLARFSPGLSSGPPAPLVLMMSRLVRVKRIRHGLEAFALLGGEAGFRMRIAGEGPLRGELEAQAAALGIGRRVSFLGACRETPALFREAGVFWHLSRSEGAPLVVLEAMASGVPVVVTDVPGNGELVRDGENGLVVPLGDRRAVVEATRRLWADPALRARLVAGGLRTILAYEPSRIAAEYLERARQAVAGCS